MYQKLGYVTPIFAPISYIIGRKTPFACRKATPFNMTDSCATHGMFRHVPLARLNMTYSSLHMGYFESRKALPQYDVLLTSFRPKASIAAVEESPKQRYVTPSLSPCCPERQRWSRNPLSRGTTALPKRQRQNGDAWANKKYIQTPKVYR